MEEREREERVSVCVSVLECSSSRVNGGSAGSSARGARAACDLFGAKRPLQGPGFSAPRFRRSFGR